MDYENVSAVINAVLKKWQATNRNAKDWNSDAMFSVDIATGQIVERFAQEVLAQLKTSFDIMERQA